MKNDAYWTNRMRILEDALLDTGYEYVQNLERQYDKAIRDIETDIAHWYQRFAKNNEISLNDARKLLNSQELKEFKWTVEEYIKYGKENAVNGAWIKQLENASARVHISRLEAIKLQLQQQAEALAAKQAEAVKGASEGVYKSSYYHTAFELQKGVGVGWTLHAIDENVIEKVLSRPWTLDKQTFSDRIWANKQALVNTVNTQITQMVMRGAAPDNTIKAIADRFKVSKSQAGRLVMTESAAFANEARKDCFKDLDVEKYVIVETLDGKTCDLCAQLDGKVYPMSEYAIGVTAPPFHPWCRGTTAPYFDDMDDIAERWARDPKTGKTYTVPGNMTYKDWEKAFVDGDKTDIEVKLSDEQIDERIKELKEKQSDLSAWGDYDTVVKDWGSVDDYFDEDDAESIAAKKQFLKYQEEIENLIKQRSANPPVQIGGVNCSVTHEQFSFSDGKGGATTPKKAVVYETPDGTKFVFPEKYDINKQTMAPDQAVEAWYKVPESVRKKAQKTIEFVDYYNPQDSYWKKKYKNFTHSYATGGDTITFYRYERPHDLDYVVKTYCHEAGHYIDKTLGVNGVSYAESSVWTKAMTDDKMVSGNKSVTKYGENSKAEDFAESLAEFIRDYSTFVQKYPNRAKLIEQILK